MRLISASPASRPIAASAELGLDAAAFLFLPLLTLASRGMAAFEGIAGLLALVLAWRGGAASRRGLKAPAMLFAGLVCWGALSSTWAVEPARSLVMALRLAGLSAAGLALLAAAAAIADADRLLRCFVFGMALGIALLLVQRLTGGLLTRPFFVRAFDAPALNQASDTLAILALPTAGALYRRGRGGLSLLLLAAAAAAIFGLVGTAAKASLAIGLVLAALSWRWRRSVARVAAVAAVAVVVSAPLTFPRLARIAPVMGAADHLKSSVSHRLLIWSFVGDRIAEKPLFGWGLDSSRAIPGGRELIRPGQAWLPLHPHNAPLQLWLELGVPGAVLGALVMARLWLGLAALGWPRLYAAACAGALAAVATETLGTYGIWQEWWLGTLWFALFLVLVTGRSLGADLPSPHTDRQQSRPW